MRVATGMTVGMSTGTFRCHLFHRHAHKLAVADAALGDDMLAEMLHIVAFPPEHCHFEACVVVEMNVQRGKRELVMIVIGIRQAL